MEKIEYRVRPVTRYVVTRWFSESIDGKDSGGCEERGEFGNADTAYDVAYALCKQEHNTRGWPLDDERIQYPHHPGAPSIHSSEYKPPVINSVSTV